MNYEKFDGKGRNGKRFSELIKSNSRIYLYR